MTHINNMMIFDYLIGGRRTQGWAGALRVGKTFTNANRRSKTFGREWSI